MARIKAPANKDKFPEQVRVGVDVPYLGGLRPDVDAVALGKADFVDLQNIRRLGGAIVGRPGQRFLVDITGRAIGLGDLQMGAKRRLVIVADGCPGESAGAGFSVSTFTPEQLPRFQPVIYDAAVLATKMTAIRYRRETDLNGLKPDIDALMFSQDNLLFKLANIPFDYGQSALDLTNGSQQVPIWSTPTPYTNILAMMQHASSLFIGVDGGAGASAIFAWDGVTFIESLGSIDPVGGFAVFRGEIIAGHESGGANRIEIYPQSGVWTTMAPGTGTVTIASNNICASFEDRLYIPSGSSIFVYDGLTLTEIPAATIGINVASTIRAIEAWHQNGYLYFTWNFGATAHVGRFDGTTWEPNHWDAVTAFPGTTGLQGIRLFNNALHVAGIRSGDARLYRSNRFDTTTFTEIVPSNVSNSAELRDLSIY